jgi:alanine-synthesizing transaminase
LQRRRLLETLLKPIAKSSKLANVCYDIRGPVLEKARQMEDEGQKIIKLNIGNIAAFGLEPPDEIVQDMIRNMPHSAGYTDSKGLFAPRRAVVHYTQEKHIRGVTVDDVYLGNGASELITMSLNALLNNGDEVLIPAPDYPLYTASVALSGGTPVHYLCDEQSDWMPDIADIRAKVTPNTKAIVVINPNNPTGALYPDAVLREIIEVARQHQLIILADEIYDKTLYDGHTHTSIAALAEDVLCLTFNGLSKNYRSCGYRAGWMVVSGEKRHARDYIEAGDPDRARRLPEHQRPGGSGRAPGPPARPRVQAAQRHSRRQRGQAQGGALHVPQARPEAVPDRRRPAVRIRAAGRGEGADRAGHRFQLGDAGSFPACLPAQFR